MLLASIRNSALNRSVMRKSFASDRSEVKRCGPVNESNPMLPSVPAVGRENTPPDPPTPIVGIGVNQLTKPVVGSLFTPRENDPEARLGRQTPTSSSALQPL